MPGYDSSSRYFPSTAVLLNEVFKLVFSLIVSIKQNGLKHTWSNVFSNDSWKIAIPALLYTLQNSLQYTALSNLDAATFQVTYQLRILTTAFFSVTILKRSLSRNQWISLLMLAIGVAFVQISPESFSLMISTTLNLILPSSYLSSSDAEQSEKSVVHRLLARAAESHKPSAAAAAHDDMNRSVGFIAVIVSAFLSGLAGVYFEKVLKGTNTSLWIRNIQLSFYSLFPAFFIGVLLKDGSKIAEKGFFFGYNYVVWSVICSQAFGGIIVALCVKFADNIAKNFATSISILVSFLALVRFFDFKVTSNFISGSVLVIFATYLYARPESKPKSQNWTLPVNEPEVEKDKTVAVDEKRE